jgi:hypothetical protein
MFTVESTDPYSTHPHLTDETFRFEDPDAAALKFAELAGWDEVDAINALLEGDLTHTDQETGREVTASRGPSSAARLTVQRAAAKTWLEVCEAAVLRAHMAPMDRQVELVAQRDDARAVAEELGVFAKAVV